MSPDLSGRIGTRVSKNVAGQTTSFLRDGAYVTDPVIADNLATYTPGISERRGGTTRYTHSGLKNTGAQSTSLIVATRMYDAYGMIRSSSGTWSGPFGYAGGYGYQEDETGLRLLGHRYYDASTGRFLTRDPIKDGRNWYSYCDGDPINGVDPTGLATVLEAIQAGIRRGILPKGTDRRYIKDKDFKDAIHREKGLRVVPGELDNPDLEVDEIIEIADELLELEEKTRRRKSEFVKKPVVKSPSRGVDWGLVGGVVVAVSIVVVAGAIIVASGGTATGPVLVGGAAALGAVIVSPQTKRRAGG